jgi:glycosyltransferase involved in cell wall biosynthesis
MRVGLLVPADHSRVGGGINYEIETFDALLRHAKNSSHEFVLFSTDGASLPTAAKEFEQVAIRWPVARQVLARIVRIMNTFLTRGIGVPHIFLPEDWLDSLLLKERIGLFVNLNPSTPTTAVPYLTIVWDLQHRFNPFFPEVSAKGRWTLCEDRFSRLLKRAAIVVVGNNCGLEQAERCYGVHPSRMRKLPHPTPAFALEAAQRGKLAPPAGLPAKYLFYPAQFWPHKNHVTLLRAMSYLRTKHAYCPPVVFSGSDQGNLAYVQRVAAELDLTDHIYFPGFVPQAEVVTLYQNAMALVYMSLCGPENLPPLEAFALGCPVICNCHEGALEQLGDAALFFEPMDEKSLADAIHAIYTQPALRDDLVRKGRLRAGKYTGDEFAHDMLDIIDRFSSWRACWSEDGGYVPRFTWRRFLNG